jgi:hypothetical protein
MCELSPEEGYKIRQQKFPVSSEVFGSNLVFLLFFVFRVFFGGTGV